MKGDSMKQKCKSLLSCLLVIVLLVCVAAPAGAVGRTSIPTVYVMGYGAAIYEVAGDTSTKLYYPVTIPADLMDTLKNDLPPLMLKGIAGNWTDFHTYMTDLTLSVTGPVALDNNGEASNGSGIFHTTYPVSPNPGQTSFDKDAYSFDYDWRLDPLYTAQILKDYIESIKTATGYDKVNVIARCYGNNVLLAYLYEFGYDSLARVVFYSPDFYGFDFANALFSGNLGIEADELEGYFTESGRELFSSMDEESYESLMKAIRFLNSGVLLNMGSFALNGYFVPEFQRYILPEVLRGSFGTLPSMWSFINDDNFEKAKKYVFGGYEDEYAGLIKKIDNYHYNVQIKAADLINGLVEREIPVYIICKYGMNQIPLSTDEGLNGDALANVYSGSFGATAAPLGKQLSKCYIKEQEKANGGKYLEPDRGVDASTCLLPDHTWFMRGVYHSTNPDSVELLIAKLLNYDGWMTVFDDPAYPQFMQYNKQTGEITPQVAGVMTPTGAQHGFLMTQIKAVMHLINKLIIKIRNWVESMR